MYLYTRDLTEGANGSPSSLETSRISLSAGYLPAGNGRRGTERRRKRGEKRKIDGDELGRVGPVR